jgi:hypothetical protein
MDRAFIEKHQVVERYLAGKLPFKAVQDFERFCKENPELLDDLELPERLNAGMRLLEASGRHPASLAHEETEGPVQPQWWRRVEVTVALAALSAVLLICLWVLGIKYAERGDKVTALEQRVASGSLQAPSRTRTIPLTPSRVPTSAVGLTLQLRETADLVELVLNVSAHRYNTYRLTIDKKDQGRAGSIHNLLRDSNGNLRLIINSSAMRPGNYKVTIEGLRARGAPVAVAWLNVRVVE